MLHFLGKASLKLFQRGIVIPHLLQWLGEKLRDNGTPTILHQHKAKVH